ncbi:uncharacterized protein LOC142239412 [Haematobia irritans]|uniref:uncharacterized protein LOC142239412 n=1 Tax=Haematobia irritans TaxID=7368 RepID=UPI003F50B24F
MGCCYLRRLSLIMAWLMLIYSTSFLLNDVLKHENKEDFIPSSMKFLMRTESAIMCALLMTLLAAIYNYLPKLMAVYFSLGLILKTSVVLIVIDRLILQEKNQERVDFMVLIFYCLCEFAISGVMSLPIFELYRNMRNR